jgi:hypothetical protein
VRNRTGRITVFQRLLLVTSVFVLADHTLLTILSQPNAELLWWQPALVLAFAVFTTVIWFPEAVRGLWFLSIVMLCAFFSVQAYALIVIRNLFGLTPWLYAAFLVVTSLPLIAAGYMIYMARMDEVRGVVRQMNRGLLSVFFGAAFLAADYILLLYFNTLVWPYLWPTNALLVLVIGFAVLFWLPEIGQSVWMFRVVGILLIFIGQSYLIHSFLVMLDDPNLLSVLHLVGVAGMMVVLVLNYINQFRPRTTPNRRHSPTRCPPSPP